MRDITPENHKYYKTLRDLMISKASDCADTSAFIYAAAGVAPLSEITYGDFFRKVKAFAEYLISEDLAGKHIAIICDNSFEWVLSFFAVTSIGSAAVLPDKALAPEKRAELISYSDCAAVISSREYYDESSDIPVIITQDLDSYILQGERIANGSFDDIRVSESCPAVIAFTSGTTGNTKGVLLSNENLMQNSYGTALTLVKVTDKHIAALPFHHMYSLMTSLIMPFSVSGTIYICGSIRYLPSFMQIPDEYIITAVPAMIPYIFNIARTFDKKKNITLICGGSSMPDAFLEDAALCGIDLRMGYGITECSPVVALMPYQKEKRCGLGMEPSKSAVIEIADPDENGIGEITVCGKSVMKGYYNMPSETEKVLKNGWFHTGDLGKKDERGLLYICGRIKNLLVLSNGENIAPEEIESILNSVPEIKECMVFSEGGILCAEIFADMKDRKNVQAALNEINRSFPPFKRISKISFRDFEFRKNSLGKIIRKDI